MKPVDQWVSAYKASSGRAADSWAAGVQSTDKDQAALAVAAESRMRSGVVDAIDSGRWRAGITRRGTPYWRQRSLDKKANFSAGITAGGDNYGNAAQKLAPAIQTAVANLPPRGDLTQNIERVRALATYLHDRRGQFKAS